MVELSSLSLSISESHSTTFKNCYLFKGISYHFISPLAFLSQSSSSLPHIPFEEYFSPLFTVLTFTQTLIIILRCYMNNSIFLSQRCYFISKPIIFIPTTAETHQIKPVLDNSKKISITKSILFLCGIFIHPYFQLLPFFH